ncbi:DUF4376 domain-containing protein [Citrobacter freundii]|jgi:hypothetical protein|uniref:DUF4376 domain-containing protein n=1 Tax=Citrobacter freundii TaxID=546 RepID=UPI003893FC6E
MEKIIMEGTPVISAVRNAVRNLSGGISCEIQFDGLVMEDGVTPLFLPYTLAETDTSPLAKKILEALESEASGGIAPYPDQDEYIERLKVEKLAEINDWRIRQESFTVYFEWNGHRWDANDISKERLDISLKAATGGLPDNFFWTDADNNDVPVTLEQLKELEMRMTQTLFDRKFSIHEHQRVMKKDILEMSDPELIKNYQVGWEDGSARR